MNSRSLYQFLVFFVGVCAVFLANQLAHRYHFRWDLTEEKRYTLHPSTINGLEQLTEAIDIEVFLEGELPANFRRLKVAVRETLEAVCLLWRGSYSVSLFGSSFGRRNESEK